jgi:copper transport protein
VVFRAGPGEAPASAAPRESPPVLAVVLRWLDFALLAGVIGALAVVAVILRPAGGNASAASRRAEGRVLALGAVCGAASLALGIFALPFQALVLMAWEPGSSAALLGQTRWGGLWLAREALAAALLAVVLLLRRAPRSEARHRACAATSLLLGPAIAVVHALAGHAAEVDRATALSVLVLALHTLAAAVWVGGVIALAVGFWPVLRRNQRADTLALLRMVWGRFGRLAAATVGLLALTGLYTAGRQVASIDALVTTLYGYGLAAKAGLLALTGGLGLLGAAAMRGRIATRRLPRPRTLLAAEAAAALTIVFAAALMSSTPPARGPGLGPAVPVPGSLTVGGGDVLLTLSASPNRPGQNVLSAVVASTRRPDPPPPSGVDLRVRGRGPSVPMRELAPGHFQLAGDQLSAGGRTRIDVVVHRRGEPDRTVGVNWTTASASRSVVISDRPLEPVLSTVAALLALAGAAAAALLPFGRMRGPALLVQADLRKDPS